MINFILILFSLLQLVLSFKSPKIFLFNYLLYITSFLGYLSNDIILFDYEIGFYFQNLLLIGNYIFYKNRIKKINLHYKRIIIIINILFIYGIVAPFLFGYSSIFQSVIESKEFSSTFLLHYLLINKNIIRLEYIKNIIEKLGYYYIIIILLFLLFNYVPPVYIKNFSQFSLKYPSLLSLFIFIKIAETDNLKSIIKSFFLLSIWIVGIYEEGHLSILLTTAFGAGILLLRVPVIKLIENYKTILIGLVFFSSLYFVLPTDEYFAELSELGSMKARAIYNQERLSMISNQPYIGYGFLHHSAFKIDNKSVYTESLSFIDSGYIDLLGKFGIIGTLFYLFIISFPILTYSTKDNFLIALKIFFLQYFFINITWSVFSFSLGTIALVIAIYMYYLKTNKAGYS